MARVLVHPLPLHIDTVLAPPGAAPRGFCPRRWPQPPRAGLAPYICHGLSTSVVAPILLDGTDVFMPNLGSLARLNTFWHKVKRWATNCFSSTPIRILAIGSCLPRMLFLVLQRQRLAALTTIGAPPGVNPATARLHRAFPSICSYRASDCSRAHTKGLSSVYLPLSMKTPRPSRPLQNHLPIDAVAHRAIAFTGSLSKLPKIHAHLIPEVSALLPQQSLMTSMYSAWKKRVIMVLIEEWSGLFPPPCLLSPPPSPTPWPLYSPGQVHGRANQPNESREKLPGGTCILQGTRV